MRLARRKFFFPLIMKLPVGRYSPLGGVLDTWLGNTQNAPTGTFAFHADERHTQKMLASFSVTGGMGSSSLWFLMIVVAAPLI